ncbi:SDR family NAD(P)-dependent oxidoreductase [Planobispora longispora]|uniref:2-hydroxycyclohexanecarboxyl-CoA dehydrogenase n=1 Tax=Planobispora longispora TaxID=28887 RepID=A0A8J3RS00_9ACTN|nr:SDR family oxidoreductase [Planobispora longispora]GIH80737.1 2-hydroxycyclohexanecarboxyl-CoA dehydrogenase [Planobispora longispora]
MRGLSLDGRTAVVTGGGGAIGAAICSDLASLGAHVIVADIDEPAAAKTAAALTDMFPTSPGTSSSAAPADAFPVSPGTLSSAAPVPGGPSGARARATHLPVDLADPASIEAFCARTGPVDILVHNAGVSIVEPFVTSDPENWDLMWRVNLRAPMLLTKLLLPGMVERGWGRLVFISSDGARAGSGGEGAYAATKAGLFGLAKTLAREAARGNVTSNVVCPGPTDTPMLRRIDAEKPGLVDKIARGIPLRRLGSPGDVAGLVAYLCTDRAAYVTGQTLSVSGGVTMH